MKSLIRSINEIKNGARAIVSGLFGTVNSIENTWTKIRFWAEGRDWDLQFGPVYGKAGTTTVIYVAPQCLFRGEKVMATDSAEKNGNGTRITMVLVGQRLQMPATGGGILTAFFASGALGNGTKWDTCQPSLSIAVTVSFIESCTFDMAVFGRAIV